MLSRFTGEQGRRRLEEALREQSVVAHDAQVASEVAGSVTLKRYEPGEAVITQGNTDTDLCLILAGVVGVEINGREVARRRAGQHVGEMGMIDPSVKRSATIRAIEETVVASIDEPAFTAIADRHPVVWRRLSVDLGKRLRERGELVKPSNERPVVFIGSTVERLPVARAIQAACQHDPWTTRLWTDGVFGAGQTPIESLAAQLHSLDFGLLVVTADDVVESRGSRNPMPRDNVVFEFGLLMGALGRDRTFMVRLRDERDIKLPSDLLGVKALEIVPGSEADLPSRVAPAVNELRSIVSRLRCR
ncbi:TIR domain-containing protein [Polyangium fumosum]|uniref:Cyclic nucleotide-binding domain-containing protein n=1 Tax=Polyangium fumosum TaxID=889272 RepID=A0A4U1J7R6_9BACT|nr:TIR domain-containing protein [Polyangium fumosum]TKD03396.1 cyclic nucleotide-binding domain-containing protein [Polyangium fumosum]